MPIKKISMPPLHYSAEEDEFFIDSIADDIESHNEEEVVAAIAPSLINTALELSKLVIDNRKHNSQKISDEDIYKIYDKSFQTVVSSTRL